MSLMPYALINCNAAPSTTKRRISHVKSKIRNQKAKPDTEYALGEPIADMVIGIRFHPKSHVVPIAYRPKASSFRL